MWTLFDNFLELVAQIWRYNGYGTAQFRLKQLLLGLKKPLKNLNVKQFSRISSRAEKAKNRLIDAQHETLSSGVQNADLKNLRLQAEGLLEAERLFLSQKAKCKFLQQGDRCTKFFHDLIK